MADETDTKTTEDKAAAAQGADAADLDEAEGGAGNPAPPEPPKNKAEADALEGKDKAEDADDTDGDDEADTDADASDDEAAADDDKAEDKPLDHDVWGTTGDEVGDSVLTLLQNSGLTTDDAKSLMYDAVQAGDVTQIDKAALEAKVGKEKATLILAGAENFITRSKAKAEAIVSEVHTTVGGKENWDAVTTWAKENVSEGELAEYREMIDAGGAKARFAAQELAGRYNSDGSNTTLSTSETAEITGDSKAASSGEKTTKAQYVEQLSAAYDRGASEAEIAAIKAARARGRAAGI
jgi:hypothetical protein